MLSLTLSHSLSFRLLYDHKAHPTLWSLLLWCKSGWGWGHLRAAARPEAQHKPQLLTRPLALYSITLAPSKAPLVFPIHQL